MENGVPSLLPMSRFCEGGHNVSALASMSQYGPQAINPPMVDFITSSLLEPRIWTVFK